MRSLARVATKSAAASSIKSAPRLTLSASRLASTFTETALGPAYTPKMATDSASKAHDDVKDAKESLPPLSAKDFQVYNHMAEHMDLFHNNFRRSWELLWNACEANKRPKNMTLKQFLDTGLRFAEHLTMHHSIEERHIFPVLGKRMPEFRGDLQAQHREIHHGLEKFEEYLKQCKRGDCEFELRGLKEHMASWGKVLWEHLDEEVQTLGAENMRKYWSKEEMMGMPM